jgi:hypothetical protein
MGVSLLPIFVVGAVAAPATLQGNGASAAYALLDRILPGASDHFVFELKADLCKEVGCFTLEDDAGKVKVRGSSTSELTAGVGAYLMDHTKLTFGW